MQIFTKVQIWRYQRRLTCFRASNPCAIDRGTRPANAQGNILQSAEQQPSSSLEGLGGGAKVCLLEYCTWNTQLQVKNTPLSPQYMLHMNPGKDALRKQTLSVHTSELQQDVSFISGSLDGQFLLSVQLCPLLLRDRPRLLHAQPR